MAKKKDYIVTRSNYTISTKHKSVGTDKVIRERDYMAIGGNGAFSNTSLPYGESNFKMTINTKTNSLRKHKYGDWLSVDGSEILTLDNLPESVSTESKIQLKPNYASMLDFAYFGSCVELLETTVKYIINNFPAELYVTDKKDYYTNENGEYLILGEDDFDNPVVVENPFAIDLFSNTLKEEGITNPLRYFSLSRQCYNILKDDGTIAECSPKWEVTNGNKRCYKNGDIINTVILANSIIVKEYYNEGNRVLITEDIFKGYHIRPSTKYVNDFFDNLEDFGKVLVNRESNPLYTATLDYITETDTGLKVHKEDCTWPSSYGWNIDISGVDYNEYIDKLYKLALVCDEYKADNLWKMLVHDSIKNMDHTFINETTNEDRDDYVLGTTKFKTLLSVYASFFDYFKRHIDNIKYSNNITYDEHNNAPDYFLSDSLNNRGWDVRSVVSTLSQDEETVPLFTGTQKHYTTSDANIAFMRNLQLNSASIASRKGTRVAIEMVLGLFGYASDDFNRNLNGTKGDYRIDEYVVVAESTEMGDIDKELDVQKYNKLKESYDEENYTDDESLQGLPVKMVYFRGEDGTELKYIIPWFDSVIEIDGSPYFQMYGGWGQAKTRPISQSDLAPKLEYLTETKTFRLYDESVKYLHIVRDISELTDIAYGDIVNGDIYYVYDLSDYEMYYSKPADENTSNYFVINDKEFCTEYSSKGWSNISVADINSGTGNGVKVLYLESLVDDNKGNNPHVGYGKYDDGKCYLEYFSQLFKYSIENGNFTDDAYSCNDGELIDGIKKCGFKLSDMVVDNVKTWYFTDRYAQNKGLYKLNKTDNPLYSAEEMDEVLIGKKAIAQRESQLEPYDFETDSRSNDESAANSVINVKKLKITFTNKESKNSEFKKYFYDCILPYVKQVIPSTTIVEYAIEDDGTEYVCQRTLPVAGISK